MTFRRNVTLGDGVDLRHDHQFLIWDRGRWRVLSLRVGRGNVRELDFPHSLPPPPFAGADSSGAKASYASAVTAKNPPATHHTQPIEPPEVSPARPARNV